LLFVVTGFAPKNSIVIVIQNPASITSKQASASPANQYNYKIIESVFCYGVFQDA
jgi:hypothetical protein